MSVENEESTARERIELQKIKEEGNKVIAGIGEGKLVKMELLKNEKEPLNNSVLTNEPVKIINEYLNCVDEKDEDLKLPNLMRVPISIHRRNTLALLDCGSQASLLALSIFKELPLSYRKAIIKEPYENITFKTISGERMAPLGYYNIKFKVQTKPPYAFEHNFYIMNELNESCILGFDFLSKNKLMLFPRNRSIGYSTRGALTILNVNALSVNSILMDKETLKLKVPEEHKEKVMSLIQSHPNVYATKLSNIGRAKNFEMEIKTIPHTPVCQKIRRIPYALMPQVKQQLNELLEAGIISKSISQYNNPLVCVRKKDNSIRVCIDFRLTNRYVCDDTFPNADLQTILDSLQGAVVYSTLDIFSAFHQVALAPVSRPLTSFSCIFGSFMYNVAPFGLKTCPAYFMRVVTSALEPILYKSAVAFSDDICVYSRSLSQHITDLELAFKLLEDAGLKLKLSKCCFFQKEIEYLGFKISAKGVEPSENKIKPIRDYPNPVSVKTLQQACGLFNYYRNWVEDYAGKAEPLYRLLKKGAKWQWGEEEQNAFDSLKKALISRPCLRLAILSRDYYLHCDASGKSCGGILTQKHPPYKEFGYENLENIPEREDDEEVVLGYFSKNFNAAQLRYSTTEREMYACLLSVRKFRQWVLGRMCYVITDHMGLRHVMDKPELGSALLQKWAYKLSEYKIKIIYRPGKLGQNSDALSRIPITEPEPSIKLPVNAFVVASFGLEDWNEAQLNDDFCKEILEKMNSKKGTKDINNEEKYKILPTGLIATKDNRIVVPETKKKEILYLNHDHMTSAHLGQAKTIDKISRKYVWRGMIVDIIKYINNCIPCNKRKVLANNKAPAKNMPSSSEVMKLLSADLIGPLTETRAQNKYICNVTDHATRYVVSFALKDKSAKLVAERLVNKVFTLFSGCKYFLTDQGNEYNAELMKQVCILFGIDKIRSSAYHSIGNSLIEKYNSTCNQMLSFYCNECPDRWDIYLRYCTLAYNVSRHASLKFSPFELFYGRYPILPTDIGPSIRYRSVENQSEIIAQQWHLALKAAEKNLLSAQHLQKLYYDKDAKMSKYEINEKVLLRIPDAPGQKLKMRYEGPWTVLRQTGESNYQLQNDKTKKLVLVHTNRMAKFRGDQNEWARKEKIIELNENDKKAAKIKLDKEKISKVEDPKRQNTQEPLIKKRGRPRLQHKNPDEKIKEKLEVKKKPRGRPPRVQQQKEAIERFDPPFDSSNKENIDPNYLQINETDKNPSNFKRGRGRPKKQQGVIAKPLVTNQTQREYIVPQEGGRYNLRHNTKQSRW